MSQDFFPEEQEYVKAVLSRLWKELGIDGHIFSPQFLCVLLDISWICD